jgi:hypothetical protein
MLGSCADALLMLSWGRGAKSNPIRNQPRGLPRGWGSGRHAQDLFFHPLPPGFTFAAWYDEVTV